MDMVNMNDNRSEWYYVWVSRAHAQSFPVVSLAIIGPVWFLVGPLLRPGCFPLSYPVFAPTAHHAN